MNPSHERLEELLRAQARGAFPPPADLSARVLSRLSDRPAPASRLALLLPRRLAAAALVAGALGLGWLATRSPRADLPAPDELSAGLGERLAVASGLRGLESLARNSQALFAEELENPIRSELSALASDARRTADSLLAGLAGPVERLIGASPDR